MEPGLYSTYIGARSAPIASMNISQPPPSTGVHSSPTQSDSNPFLDTGWEPDQILNIAFESGIINAQGFGIDYRFDFKPLFEDELSTAAANLHFPIKADNMGISVATSQDEKKFVSIPLINLIYAINQAIEDKLVGGNKIASALEIIGGAVPYLLTKNFYFNYLATRFRIRSDKANQLIAPFISTCKSKPNDYDLRKWIEGPSPEFLITKPKYKQFMAATIGEITSLPRETIMQGGFQKINHINQPSLLYGMARLGSFQGSPLEFITIAKTDRPYLFSRDWMVLKVDITKDRYNKLSAQLKFNFRQLPEQDPSRRFSEETAILHQLAMVLDAPHLDHIDWHGWLIGITLITKGWRTLRSDFFPTLWSSFVDKISKDSEISFDQLNFEIAWAEKNHLVPSTRTSLLKYQSLYLRLHILFYLIDHNLLNDGEQTEEYIESIFQLYDVIPRHERGRQLQKHPQSYLQNTVHSLKPILQQRSVPIKTRLAWFRFGLALYAEQNGIDKGSISTNFGIEAWRIPSILGSEATLWIPTLVEESVRLITESVESEPTEMIELVQSLLNIKNPNELIRSYKPFHTIPRGVLESLSTALKVKSIPQHLRLALHIDLSRVENNEIKFPPIDWIPHLPDFLKSKPELFGHFRRTLSTGRALDLNSCSKETVLAPDQWVLFLLESENNQVFSYGLQALAKLSETDTEKLKSLIESLAGEHSKYLTLYRKLWLQKHLFNPVTVNRVIHHYLEEVIGHLVTQENTPLVLFLLAVRGSYKGITIDINHQQGVCNVIFDDPKLRIPVPYINFIEKAIEVLRRGKEDLSDIKPILDQLLFTSDFKKLNGKGLLENERFSGYINELNNSPIGSKRFELGIQFAQFRRSQTRTPSPLPPRWILQFPEIHAAYPELRQEFSQWFTKNSLCSAHAVQDHVTDDMWMNALLLDSNSQFRAAGIRQLKTLSLEVRKQLWESITDYLFDHPTLIHEIVKNADLFGQSQAELKPFYIKWITYALQNKNFSDKCATHFTTILPRKVNEYTEVYLKRMLTELERVEVIRAPKKPKKVRERAEPKSNSEPRPTLQTPPTPPINRPNHLVKTWTIDDLKILNKVHLIPIYGGISSYAIFTINRLYYITLGTKELIAECAKQVHTYTVLTGKDPKYLTEQICQPISSEKMLQNCSIFFISGVICSFILYRTAILVHDQYNLLPPEPVRPPSRYTQINRKTNQKSTSDKTMFLFNRQSVFSTYCVILGLFVAMETIYRYIDGQAGGVAFTRQCSSKIPPLFQQDRYRFQYLKSHSQDSLISSAQQSICGIKTNNLFDPYLVLFGLFCFFISGIIGYLPKKPGDNK